MATRANRVRIGFWPQLAVNGRSTMCLYPLALGLFLTGFTGAEAGEDIVPRDAKLDKVASGCKFTEGPAADADGNLFFTDSPRNFIMVLRPGGKLEVWDKNSGDANGMRFDAKGRLVACCGEDGKRPSSVTRRTAPRLLADRYKGKRLTALTTCASIRVDLLHGPVPAWPPAEGRSGAFAVYASRRKMRPAGKIKRVIDARHAQQHRPAPDGKTLLRGG